MAILLTVLTVLAIIILSLIPGHILMSGVRFIICLVVILTAIYLIYSFWNSVIKGVIL